MKYTQELDTEYIDFFNKFANLSNVEEFGKIEYRISKEDLSTIENDFLSEAQLFLDQTSYFLKEYESLIVLTDYQGRILDIRNNQLGGMVYRNYFEETILLSESSIGTKSIVSAILNKKVEMTIDDELYDNKMISISSPVIINDNILGTISIMGKIYNIKDIALGIIDYTSRLISHNILIRNKEYEKNTINEYKNTILECINDGFLIIDNKGIVQYINGVGADILGINKDSSIGKHVTKLVDFRPIILDVLETGEGYIDREFFIKDNKTGEDYHFIKTMMPIKDSNGELIGVVDNFRKIKRVKEMVNSIVGNKGKFKFDDIIGTSGEIAYCKKMAIIASRSDSRVLITGESGTGKELFVQSIHNASKRSNGSIVAINCSAIPSELLESELFGYEAGSFTGALKSGKMGKFELANGGTIFLDEIGDMPLHMQAKLLRVLQEGKVTRVGSAYSIDVDVRVISATNKNLLEECRRGNFREDLYYRLNVLNVHIPPLRDRKEDIIHLAEHFVRIYGKKLEKDIKYISNSSSISLLEYNWPGNVRELENVIERAINLSTSDTIESNHLPKHITNSKGIIINKVYKNGEEEIEVEEFEIRSLNDMEKDIIGKTLEYFDGNITRTAKALDISRNTLYNKMEKYNIK